MLHNPNNTLKLLENMCHHATYLPKKYFQQHKYSEFLGLEYTFDGYGYVASQSIMEGTIIDKSMKLEVLLGNIKPN